MKNYRTEMKAGKVSESKCNVINFAKKSNIGNIVKLAIINNIL